MEGVEPSASGLEADCSPRSTPLSVFLLYTAFAASLQTGFSWSAEGEGVEPSRACGLALCSTQVPSPLGLPFRLPSLLAFINGGQVRL